MFFYSIKIEKFQFQLFKVKAMLKSETTNYVNSKEMKTIVLVIKSVNINSRTYIESKYHLL